MLQPQEPQTNELETAFRVLGGVFDQIPQPVVIVGNDWVIRQANAAFCRLVERTPEQVNGCPVSQVIRAERGMPSPQQTPPNHVSLFHAETSLPHPSRQFLRVAMVRIPVNGSGAVAMIFNNETESKRLDQSKTEFIHIAAHELRTPLTYTLGYAELLKDALDGHIGDVEKYYLSGLLKGIERLKRVADDLALYADLNTGRKCFASTFDLFDLVTSLLDELSPLVEEKHLEVGLPRHFPNVQMTTDATLVGAVLRHLILNSINFNRDGGRIRVHVKPAPESVWMRIEDTGIGIPQAALEAISQPFFQVEEHNTRQVNGLGLGLSIVKKAVKRLGGDLSIQSNLGQGTNAVLTIPTRLPQPDKKVSP